MTNHPLFWLAILTFLLIVGFAAWNYASTRRQQKQGSKPKGLGGKHDPLA